MRRTAPFFILVSTLGLLACADSLTDPADRNDMPFGVDPRPERLYRVPAAAIAFVSSRDGAEAIYVANADGSNVTRLTEGSSPAWSWDGRRIAFVRKASSTGPAGIYVIDFDGSALTHVGDGFDPAWSPNGRIAFIRVPWRTPAGNGLYVVDADGSGGTELLRHSWLCTSSADCADRYAILHPVWSPDGRSIAFQAYLRADGRSMGIVNSDGTDPRLFEELVDLGEGSRSSRGVNTRAAWSPDGSTIAFITGNPWFFSSYPYLIYTYDTRSHALQVVHSAPGLGIGGAPDNPDWAPDGRRIVFDASSHDGDPRVHRRIFTVSVETGDVRQLIAEAANPGNPDYRDYGAVWSRVTH